MGPVPTWRYVYTNDDGMNTTITVSQDTCIPMMAWEVGWVSTSIGNVATGMYPCMILLYSVSTYIYILVS
jgi:hypothetical protein